MTRTSVVLSRRASGLWASAGLAGALLFARQATAADPRAFVPPIEERRLANGLRVVLAPDDALSDVSLIVRYEAGSGDDPGGKEGLAHVTEHVLFGAFRHGAHARLLLQGGASYVNARTGLDFTSFEETIPPEALELALWLEGARMATAPDPVDERVVVRERTVAMREHEQRPGRLPALGWLFDVAWDELYPEWHPYHYPADPLSALSQIEAADVQAFAATWYGPSNASVILAGRFDAARTLQWVEMYFGGIAARPAPARPALPTLPVPGNLWLDVEALVTNPVAVMAWRGPAIHSPEERALSVAQWLLGGPHGTLRRRFVDDDRGALRVTVREMPAMAASTFAIAVEPAAGVSLAELLPAVQAAVATLPDELSEADIDRFKQHLSVGWMTSLDTSMARASHLEDPHAPASWELHDFDGVDSTTLADSIRRLLAPWRRVTMVVRPATRPLLGAPAVLLHRERIPR